MGLEPGISEMEALSRTAAGLRPCLLRGKTAPRLLFFTDPARTPMPEAVAERLPAGSAVVFRAFGAADALERALRLRAIADRRGLVLLIGADPDLATSAGADGVHLPERLMAEAPALRRAHPDWLITAAAHDAPAARAAAGLAIDAIVVSPVFASNSPSAGPPLGVAGLAAIVAAATAPAYALGGVRARNVEQLQGSGVVGIAAVEALAAKPGT